MNSFKISAKKLASYSFLLILVICGTLFARHLLFRNVAYKDSMPSQRALDAVDTSGANGVEGIRKLWKSRYIPQRLYATEKFRSLWYKHKDARRQLRPMLKNLVNCGMFETIKIATAIIGWTSPDDLKHILPLLEDPDPEIRYLAAKALLKGGNVKLTSYAAALLDDDDKRMRITAASILRRWHKRDFGVRWNANEQRNNRGVNLWRQWVKKNSGNENKNKFTAEAQYRDFALAPDFELPDLNGKQFKLSESKQEMVVLYFWGKPEHGEIAEMRHLAEFRDKYLDKVLVVPIAVDAVPQVHLDHHCHNECKPDKAQIVSAIKNNWQKLGFGGRCLVDEGSASCRYISNNLPTTVIIKNGKVVRHFSTNRSSKEMAAIIEKTLDK